MPLWLLMPLWLIAIDALVAIYALVAIDALVAIYALVFSVFFFGLFPIWDRRIEFLFSAFFRIVSLSLSLSLSLALALRTPVSFMSFSMTSLHLSFGFPILQWPLISIFHVLITIPQGITFEKARRVTNRSLKMTIWSLGSDLL